MYKQEMDKLLEEIKTKTSVKILAIEFLVISTSSFKEPSTSENLCVISVLILLQ